MGLTDDEMKELLEAQSNNDDEKVNFFMKKLGLLLEDYPQEDLQEYTHDEAHNDYGITTGDFGSKINIDLDSVGFHSEDDLFESPEIDDNRGIVMYPTEEIETKEIELSGEIDNGAIKSFAEKGVSNLFISSGDRIVVNTERNKVYDIKPLDDFFVVIKNDTVFNTSDWIKLTLFDSLYFKLKGSNNNKFNTRLLLKVSKIKR